MWFAYVRIRAINRSSASKSSILLSERSITVVIKYELDLRNKQGKI